MKEIKKYVADDGTIFEDEDECYEYELNLRITSLKDRVRLFDHKMTELPLSEESFENCYGIGIYDVNAIAEIKTICGAELGIYHPWHRDVGGCEEEKGLYVYSDDNERWYNLNIEGRKIQEILAKISF